MKMKRYVSDPFVTELVVEVSPVWLRPQTFSMTELIFDGTYYVIKSGTDDEPLHR